MGPLRLLAGTPLLFLLPLVASALGPAPDERELARALQEVERRFDEERKQWRAFREQAASDEERAALAAAFPSGEFRGELVSIATAAKGTDVAARAWLTVYRMGCMLDDRAIFAQSLERLLADHAATPVIASLMLELVYGAPSWSVPAAQSALRQILAANQNQGIRASALAQLALLVGLDNSLGAAGRAEAETLLARIEAEFGADEFNGMSGKEFAAGARFEIEHLRVGMVVPDFERNDQEGVRFKLSDYRGRVVLLDFWGFV